MSGRGLGHTGGTLDKLESIPGFRDELTLDEFIAQVRDVGIGDRRPDRRSRAADKLLYALRDVTATVDQLSLIAASIMSKKLAAGAQAIVLDVKVGDGAFMKTIEDARRLAEAMISPRAQQAGREVVCLLTDMDQPLGAAVGNALEVLEALETVRGRRPGRLHELVLDACGKLLALSDLGIDEAEGRRRAEAGDGRRQRRVDVEPLDRGAGRTTATRPRYRRAPIVREVTARRAGHVHDLCAIRVGNAAVHLGAGRRTKEDASTTRSAIVCHAKRGAEVETGEVLAEVHARTRNRRTWPPGGSRGVRAHRHAPHERHVLLEVVD